VSGKIKTQITNWEEPPGLGKFMAQVSIIILTYNSAQHIDKLLKSLDSFRDDAEILIVDNASTDETVKIARKFGEKVKVYETGGNMGFAKGINFGSEKAKGEYLLFINPDSIFKKGSLIDMISVLEENEKAAVVGGKMISESGVSERSAGKFFNLWETLLIVLGLDEKLGVRFSPDKLTKVDFVSGGFMMVKSNIFKRLSGFDENFFMYVEDMEFCYRVKKAELETYFTPAVAISHKGQGSSNRTFAVVNIYKGIIYFYKKHKGNFQYNIVRSLLWLKACGIYLVGRLTNNEYYVKTYKEALSLI
jgi:GT2 family glycosyltransferase